MDVIRISLFGKFSIEANNSFIHRLESRKAEELLIYLLLYRERPPPRDHLADVLWGEITPEQSKSYLRKALWQLQSFLEISGGEEILLVEGEWLQVNSHLNLWLDIAVFEEAFKGSQGIQGGELEEEQIQAIREATRIYRGDLLEGWYQNWCLYERERLQHQYLAMVDKLMEYYETNHQYEAGLEYGEKIIRYDRARERTHRRLMRLYYLAGDRTAALRQFQKCVETLKEELDVEPAERTRLLHAMIQADNLDGTVSPTRISADLLTETRKESLNVIFHRLSGFQKALTQLQKQLDQDIKAIQNALKGDQ
jgi:DNA-binding SARP family transcriptional activator